MYSVLMADDEELIRTGFKTKVPWADLGFEFWEPCEDGKEALSVLSAARPDVLLTDISMPHVDGLELCRIVNAEYPDVLLVVLSGFDDFEYARTALRYRVWDYILKPLALEELKQFLVRLRAELDSRRETAKAGTEAVGRHLVRGEVPETLAAESLRLLGPGWPGQFWVCAFLKTVFPGDLGRSVALPTEGSALAVAQDDVAGDRFHRWKILFRGPDAATVRRQAFFGTRKLVLDLRSGGNWAAAGLGEARSGIADLPVSGREAEEALALRFLSHEEVYSAVPGDKETGGCGLAPLAPAWRRTLLTGTSAEVDGLRGEFEAALKAAPRFPKRLADELQTVFNAVIDLHPSPEEAADLLSFTSAQDGADLVRRFEGLCRLVRSRLDLEGSPSADQKIREFEVLVARKFFDPQLGLDQISRELSLSPSYLTKLVRRKLGRSFLDCLTEVRIAEAQKLLAATNLMTYEIAEKVGYSDARYFSSSFKKKTGLTPSEFRTRRRNPA